MLHGDHMKIKVDLPVNVKPRNRLALAARQRNAGAHEALHPKRTARRKAKQQMQKNLLRQIKDGDVQ